GQRAQRFCQRQTGRAGDQIQQQRRQRRHTQNAHEQGVAPALPVVKLQDRVAHFLGATHHVPGTVTGEKRALISARVAAGSTSSKRSGWKVFARYSISAICTGESLKRCQTPATRPSSTARSEEKPGAEISRSKLACAVLASTPEPSTSPPRAAICVPPVAI